MMRSIVGDLDIGLVVDTVAFVGARTPWYVLSGERYDDERDAAVAFRTFLATRERLVATATTCGPKTQEALVCLLSAGL